VTQSKSDVNIQPSHPPIPDRRVVQLPINVKCTDRLVAGDLLDRLHLRQKKAFVSLVKNYFLGSENFFANSSSLDNGLGVTAYQNRVGAGGPEQKAAR
jgi:hypothetical protein